MENKQIPTININVNFENKNYQILVNYLITVGQLKQTILNYFQKNTMNYNLYYQNIKININDNRPISLFFYTDKKPLLFLLDKKTLLPLQKLTSKITLFTNLKEDKVLKQLINFFHIKNIPFYAKVENSINGIYNIEFKNEKIAEEFKIFFDKNTKKNINYLGIKKIHKSLSTNIVNKSAYINKNNFYFPKINVKENSLEKTERKIRKKNKDNYQGMYLYPYMSPEEKYLKEAYNDKVNWICKQNFLVSVGHYKMKDNFIQNYVMATPSEPPVCHKFREVNKNKWINKKGFFL